MTKECYSGKDKLVNSISCVLAGQIDRDQFEESLKSIFKDIENFNRRIIVFIDEINFIFDAGKVEGKNKFEIFGKINLESCIFRYNGCDEFIETSIRHEFSY
jgi:hypothetical protein